MPEESQKLVIDTSAFFSKSSRLGSLVQGGSKLLTIDLVIFEFVKTIEVEINEATQAKRQKRVEMLKAIKERFPKLLRSLEIEIISPQFSIADLEKLYAEVKNGKDPGDCMIWLKMQNAGVNSIITQNISDWKELGANVVLV